MADRRKQIILLLGSRFDYSFEPETFTGKVVRRGATAGKGSPSHWQACPFCDGGSKRDKYNHLVACTTCDGTGRKRVDDYTGETVVTGEDRDVPMAELLRRDTRHVKCPDCQDLKGDPTGVVHGRPCRRCKGSGEAEIAGSWLSEPVDPDRQGGDALDAMLNAIERRNLVGSYHDLDVALAGIAHHANKPLEYAALTLNAAHTLRLLDELYVVRCKPLPAPSSFDGALLELALAYLDWRMPDPIVVPRDVQRNAEERARVLAKGQVLTALERERRDKRIRRWDREGKPRQWIGQQTGLSDRQLREIINGKVEAA